MLAPDLELILENSFDSTWVLDVATFQLAYTNKTPTEALLGYPVNLYMNDSTFWLSLIHESDRDLALENNKKCLELGRSSATYRMIRSDGSVIWVLNRQKLVKDATGKARYIIGSTVEVSDMQNFKELDSFFSLSLDLLCIAGMDGYLKKVNPAFANVLGYTSTELLTTRFISFLHPEDIEKTVREMEKIKECKQSSNFENRYRCKDGDYKILNWRIVFSERNELLYCVARDVTKERKNTELLDRTKKLLESTQSLTHVGGWEIHLENKTLYWTKETYLIHDTTPEEFTPDLNTAIDFYVPEHIPIISSAVEDAIAHGKPFDLELEIITLKKRRIWVRAVAHPVVIDGVAVKLNGIFQELTEIKRAAAEMEAQKQKMVASAKMSSLGEMAAGIAHEINNPLTIIIGTGLVMKEILESGKMDPLIWHKQLDNLITTAERIDKIIKGLHAFSRNSNHEKIQQCSLKSIINDILPFCFERFKSRGITLELNLPEISFSCRPTLISQVILNLLNNSYDAVTELDEKWVELRAYTEKDQLHIEVTDSGKGIPEGIAEKIMMPFFTTKDIGKGTGLGLSISKGIVEEHKGTILLDNKCENTRIVVKLPIH